MSKPDKQATHPRHRGWRTAFSEAELSRLLFDAREIVSMYGDVVHARTGQRDDWCTRTRDGLDAYRAERGWSPHGFGGESG